MCKAILENKSNSYCHIEKKTDLIRALLKNKKIPEINQRRV